MTGPTPHLPNEEPQDLAGTGPPGDGSVHQLTAHMDAASLMREVNDSSEAIEDQCLRTQQAADIATASAEAARRAEAAVREAKVAHHAAQAERPRRRAPLPRQRLIALVTVMLDGLACFFAAQALNGTLASTLVWAALFLAVLAGGEVALDHYRERSIRAWRALVVLLGGFVLVLGVLRFSFLATVGDGGLIPAVAGAALFTAATGGFLFLGYRALRAAETRQAWRARRRVLAAAQATRAARETAQRDARERDRLIQAYLVQVRRLVLRTCPLAQQRAVEDAVRIHLLGREAA